MNKLAKGFLLAFTAIVVVLLLIVVGAHLYVESAGVQSRIETAVSQQLKMPVKAAYIRFSLWSGLRVEEVVVGDDPEKPFARVPEISARVAWRPLIFSRRLVVRELRISSPEVHWQQTRSGKWDLPKTAKPKESKPKDETAKAPKEPKEPKEEKAVTRKKEERPRVEFSIVQARIDNGTFVFLNRKGEPIAHLKGVSVRIPLLTHDSAEGTAMIEQVVLRDRLRIDKITSPFEFREEKLTLPKLTAVIAQGKVEGMGTLEPTKDDSPFTASVNFTDVDLGRLLTDLKASGFTHSEGKLSGFLALEGETDTPKSIKGNGEARLEGGKMEQYPLLQALGQQLQIAELTELHLKRAHLKTEIRKTRVYVNDLTLESDNLTLAAQGTVRFDKKLDLDTTLTLNEKIARQLPDLIVSNLSRSPDSKGITLPFKVTGTLEDPETDLIRAIMGEQLERQANDLIRAIKGFTSPRKEKEKKKKK